MNIKLQTSSKFEASNESMREQTSRSPPRQTEMEPACAEKIYNSPKQIGDRRHETKAALTEWRLLEHCSSSFPETDLSQATQAAAPEGDTGTNWCPLAAPGFSFPSFTFTWRKRVRNIFLKNDSRCFRWCQGKEQRFRFPKGGKVI